MVKVEGHRIIRAPVQKVFQLVSRLDAAPRVTGLWLTADPIEKRPNALTIHHRGYFAGMPVESVQRAVLEPPQRVEFRQTRGSLKSFRGQYVLKPIEGDTDLSLTVEADVGIPLISDTSARLVLHLYVERTLEKLKLTAERDLPRALPRRAHEPPSPPAETAEGSAEPALPPAPPPQPAAPPAPASAAAASSGRKRRRRRRRRKPRQSGGKGA